MSLFVLGDPHLSLGSAKPMDIFGGTWVGYVEKLVAGFRVVGPEDTVVLCGDLSWGMSLQEAEPDFAFLHTLPGKKIFLKGNHDYWWETTTKMTRFFAERGFSDFSVLHNNCFFYQGVALCGTRGWFLDEEKKGHNEKMMRREVIRLETSLKAAGEREKYCFLHYPPVYQGYECAGILELLERYQVKHCCYGHLHGHSMRLAVEGKRGETEFSLVSADHLGFVPKKILD